jgi:hypothetical protein
MKLYCEIDNSELPCSLCVTWEYIDPQDYDTYYPVLPSGPVTKLYRFMHEECLDGLLEPNEDS